MPENDENIGIQPIHIRFSTNMNDDKSQIFTKKMIYNPPKKGEEDTEKEKEEKEEKEEKSNNPEKTSDFPLFTDNVKFPVNTILKLPKEYQKEIFFSPLEFKKLIGNKVEKDIEVRNKNAKDNIIILLNILFPISFPIKSNIRETFSENIEDTIINLNTDENESMFSTLSDFIDQPENEYSYCNFNRPYTVSKVTLINDIINDSIFSELIQLSSNFQLIRQKKIDEYNKKVNELLTTIKKNIAAQFINIQNTFKDVNTPVNDTYKKIINKKSSINREAKHPPALMEPYLTSLIDEDKSNVENIINTFVKLYELKEASTDPNYIPFTFTKLKGFSDLLNDSFNYFIQKQILDSITQLNVANAYFKKEKEDSKSLTSTEKKIISTLKSFNIFDTFLKTINKFKSPTRSYTNEYLSKVLNNSGSEMDEYIKLIDYINKINKEERPKDELLNNDTMKDKLQTGIMRVLEQKQPQKTEGGENKEMPKKITDDPLQNTMNKFYDVMIDLELIDGVLDDNTLDDIKCPYKNEYLVENYKKLKYADQKNPILFYNNFKVFDMGKYTKKNKTSKKTMKGGFPANANKSESVRNNKKTRRNRRKRQNKSIRSIYKSQQRVSVN